MLIRERLTELMQTAPRCGLLLDIMKDGFSYKTIEGRKRSLYAGVRYSATKEAAQISYSVRGMSGRINLAAAHECYIVAAVAAGYIEQVEALEDIQKTAAKLVNVVSSDLSYFRRTAKPSSTRRKEMMENVRFASSLADKAAAIIKLNPEEDSLFCSTWHIAKDLAAVAAAGIETGLVKPTARHAAEVAAWLEKVAETVKALEGVKREEKRAARAAESEAKPAEDNNTVVLVETTYDIRNGGQSSRRVICSTESGLVELPEAVQEDAAPAERPETISEGNADPDTFTDISPEQIREKLAASGIVNGEVVEPEKLEANSFIKQVVSDVEKLAALPAPETVHDAPPPVQSFAAFRAARKPPEKPPRGPATPKEFAGQIITGNGWQIVFDTALQRTRVVIQEDAREKLAPITEAAGFYYSVNTDSWHKKLTHKAYRAALALAETLRAAVAAA